MLDVAGRMGWETVALHAWFRRVLGDDAQCHDLVQDTLLAALEERLGEDQGARLWAIARAHLAAHLAVRRRRALLGDPPLDDDDPSAVVLLRHDAQKLHAAIATLSKRLREPLELFYFESLGSARIAERLGLPHATVRTRLHRARLSLRRAVAGVSPDPARASSLP